MQESKLVIQIDEDESSPSTSPLSSARLKHYVGDSDAFYHLIRQLTDIETCDKTILVDAQNHPFLSRRADHRGGQMGHTFRVNDWIIKESNFWIPWENIVEDVEYRREALHLTIDHFLHEPFVIMVYEAVRQLSSVLAPFLVAHHPFTFGEKPPQPDIPYPAIRVHHENEDALPTRFFCMPYLSHCTWEDLLSQQVSAPLWTQLWRNVSARLHLLNYYGVFHNDVHLRNVLFDCSVKRGAHILIDYSLSSFRPVHGTLYPPDKVRHSIRAFDKLVASDILAPLSTHEDEVFPAIEAFYANPTAFHKSVPKRKSVPPFDAYYFSKRLAASLYSRLQVRLKEVDAFIDFFERHVPQLTGIHGALSVPVYAQERDSFDEWTQSEFTHAFYPN